MSRTMLLCAFIAAALLSLNAPSALANTRYGYNADFSENPWINRAMPRRSVAEVAKSPAKKTKKARKAKQKGSSFQQVAKAAEGAFQSGIASYYWQPQKVASGGWFNPKP